MAREVKDQEGSAWQIGRAGVGGDVDVENWDRNRAQGTQCVCWARDTMKVSGKAGKEAGHAGFSQETRLNHKSTGIWPVTFNGLEFLG